MSLRRAATELVEDHPQILAMQDSHFEQIEGSFDSRRDIIDHRSE
jgi:hypothetical protein